MCPVKTYELYIERLDPENPNLWQQAKTKIVWNDNIWFTKEPQSKNKIGALLSTLSTNAKLSKHYTNHCVRATCVTILDKIGYEARHIMTVSGHKKVESIQSYSCNTSNEKKRQMAESLSREIIRSPKIARVETEEKPEKVTKPATPQIGSPVEKANFDVSNMSFRELLQLDEEQEKALLQEIFSDEDNSFDQVNNPVNIVKTSTNNNNVNPVAMRTQNIVPKMMFNNSTVTINFNISKN